MVGSGFAEVGPDRVTLLVDSCEAAEDVDQQAAQRDLDDATKVMGTADGNSLEYAEAQKLAAMSRARLSV